MIVDPVIVYEDDDVFVMDKPFGMPSQPDFSRERSLLDWCRQSVPKAELVHRLDRPVGGLLLLAKTVEANRRLQDAMRRGAVSKKYLAVVEGRMPAASGMLTDYIQKVKGPRGIVVSEKVPQGKKAVLSYKQIAVKGDGTTQRSLLEIELQTGRFHQIRVQLSHAGCPIVNDRKYNENNNPAAGRCIGLYAYKLSFAHPVTGENLSFRKMPDVETFKEFKGEYDDE